MILAVLLAGLAAIVWWRIGQCRALGVSYMDPGREAALIITGLIGAAWAAAAAFAVAWL